MYGAPASGGSPCRAHRARTTFSGFMGAGGEDRRRENSNKGYPRIRTRANHRTGENSAKNRLAQLVDLALERNAGVGMVARVRAHTRWLERTDESCARTRSAHQECSSPS